MGLLKTIVILVLVWYAIKLIGRYVMPYVLNKGMQKVQRNMEDKMRQAQEKHRPQEREGNISVENENQPSRRTSNNSVGEYVEFEEVE